MNGLRIADCGLRIQGSRRRAAMLVCQFTRHSCPVFLAPRTRLKLATVRSPELADKHVCPTPRALTACLPQSAVRNPQSEIYPCHAL
jgi:hypothetical protein